MCIVVAGQKLCKIVLFFLLLRTNAMFLHKKINSSDSVNTWCNVSLQIELIAFGLIQKDPPSFKRNLFASRSNVILS